MLTRPRGLLIDYGETLVEEVGFDPRAGTAMLLSRAAHVPSHVTLEMVLDRANAISNEVAARRDRCLVETPWPMLTRLIHDYFGTRFDEPMPQLELAFWQASMTTHAMSGARDALDEVRRRGMPMGVVSNTSFRHEVIRYELDKHGLADHLAFVVASADYAVRKPHPLLFETAAARLGVAPRDIWFVGDRLDTDVAGARAAGMTAVWFRPPGSEEVGSADLTVASWAELVELIDGIVRNEMRLAGEWET